MEEIKYPEQIEIAWTVKYFLDALYGKNHADFNAQSGELFQTYPKPDGTILVVDKDKASLGRMEICEGEQWFDVEKLRQGWGNIARRPEGRKISATMGKRMGYSARGMVK